MENNFGYILGSNIRAERLRRHLTQEQLAEKLDMSINYVGKLERGVIIPSAQVIKNSSNRCERIVQRNHIKLLTINF